MKSSFLLPLLLVSPLAAAPRAEPPHVRADLLSESAAVRPGTPFTVAVRLRHDPGWHTYWRNPGDAGLPTRAEWRLPPGFSAGPIQWPVPGRIGDETVLNYGYSGEVLLPVEIVPPGDLPKGEAALAARLTWLECKDVCIPGEAEVSLRLPVSKRPAPPDEKIVSLFALARTRLPLPAGLRNLRAGIGGGRLWLSFPASVGEGPFDFFPGDHDIYEAPKDRREQRRGGDVLLDFQAPERASAGTLLSGVLVSESGWRGPGSERGLSVEAPLAAAPPSLPAMPGERAAPPPAEKSPAGFWLSVGLAFLGGMLLNLMPCVLPVLSIKILSFLRQAGGNAAAARRHGFLYSAGVLVSFWILAGTLLALRAAGKSLGWGFQLQSPVFVAFLAVLFLLLALNLFGLFEIGTSLTRLGGAAAGAFGGGVLAVVAATPCTAPFMGAALGYALARPPLESLAVFTSLGVGMAWPYAALTSSPRLLNLLPKPGPWMLAVKKFLGLMLLGTALWLGWVFARQILPSIGTPADSFWEPFSAARVEQLREEGRPVFVDFTADWCLTCRVNERIALRDEAVRRRFRELNVAALKADWTRRDPAVTQSLSEQGRASVPMYLLYPPDSKNEPQVLHTILTPKIVLDALKIYTNMSFTRNAELHLSRNSELI